jgi:hypothetical protein
MAYKHVFLSYCHDNLDEVAELHKDLTRAREAVWWDQDVLPGQDWDYEIQAAIKDSYAVLLCLSKEALSRTTSGLYTEALTAVATLRKYKPGSIFLIPVRLSDCEIPAIEIDDTRRLDRLEYIDLFPAAGRDAALKKLVKAIQATPNHPLPGQPGNSGGKRAGPPLIAPTRLQVTGKVFRGREAELAMLDQAWDSGQSERPKPKFNVVSLVGQGGSGKTALVLSWQARLANDQWRGAERIFEWSFFPQGSGDQNAGGTDSFFSKAFEFFGEPEPEELRDLWAKGRHLANLVSEQRALLILDSLESLQLPPGAHTGQLKDDALKALLGGLAQRNSGLCVVTTRLALADFTHFEGHTWHSHELDRLSTETGIDLLKDLGVRGDKGEIEQVVDREFQGHALALNLLGNYLRKATRDQDIRHWREVKLMAADKRFGEPAERMFRAYERWLSKDRPDLLAILHILGLFNRPADRGCLRVLRSGPPIKNLTGLLVEQSEEEWNFAVSELREELRLISISRDGQIDAHALLHQYFAERLQVEQQDAWRTAHSVLFEYLRDATPRLPDSLEGLLPLYNAVDHGCRAGRHQEVIEHVYWDRILRGQERYSTEMLGAISTDLAALSSFFDRTWTLPSRYLTDHWKGVVLSWAGHHLRALGRLAEALPPMTASLDFALLATRSREDVWAAWKDAAIRASNLSNLLLYMGRIDEAVTRGRECVEYARRSGSWMQGLKNCTTLIDAYHQAGDWQAANTLFLEIRQKMQTRPPDEPPLSSPWLFRLCDILLSQERFREAQELAEQAVAMPADQTTLLADALDSLTLGEAGLLQARTNSEFQSVAEGYLDKAERQLRAAGQQQYQPRGFIARARLHRFRGNWIEAWHELDQARETAERGEMLLHLADFHVEAAWLALAWESAVGDRFARELASLGSARYHYHQATKLIAQTGYHRHKQEVKELESSLRTKAP